MFDELLLPQGQDSSGQNTPVEETSKSTPLKDQEDFSEFEALAQKAQGSAPLSTFNISQTLVFTWVCIQLKKPKKFLSPSKIS